jgi:ABC-type thiamin/hydroxymethylpyrimidine transport system permease subunit
VKIVRIIFVILFSLLIVTACFALYTVIYEFFYPGYNATLQMFSLAGVLAIILFSSYMVVNMIMKLCKHKNNKCEEHE